MNNTKKHHFQLLNGRTVVIDQECTFDGIRRLGDTMASAQGRYLTVQAYNEATKRWDYLGIFKGNRQFLNWDRDYWTINSDYRGMTRMTARKGDAV